MNGKSEQQEPRYIPLTQGQFAIVDASDYEWLSQWKWYAAFDKKRKCFDARRRANIRMHRLIIGCKSGEEADHRNRNSLDNRRENLRKATNAQQNWNRGKFHHNACGFKGVTFSKRPKNHLRPWRARIGLGSRRIHIGWFATVEEAGKAYEKKAEELYGEFAAHRA